MYAAVATDRVPASPPPAFADFVVPVLRDGEVVMWHEHLARLLIEARSSSARGTTTSEDAARWITTFSVRQWVGDDDLVVLLTRVAATTGAALSALRRFVAPGRSIPVARLGEILGELDLARDVVATADIDALTLVDEAGRILFAVPCGYVRPLGRTAALHATTAGLRYTIDDGDVLVWTVDRGPSGVLVSDATGTSLSASAALASLVETSARVRSGTLDALFTPTIDALTDVLETAVRLGRPVEVYDLRPGGTTMDTEESGRTVAED